MAAASRSKRRQEGGDETAVRARILEAAFKAFMKRGYAMASTLVAQCAPEAGKGDNFGNGVSGKSAGAGQN